MTTPHKKTNEALTATASVLPNFPQKTHPKLQNQLLFIESAVITGVSLWIFRCVFSELSAKEKQHVCGLGGAFDGNTLDGECLITFHFKLSLL